jgi:hypothetical protein
MNQLIEKLMAEWMESHPMPAYPPRIPAGTPNRRQLQNQQNSAHSAGPLRQWDLAYCAAMAIAKKQARSEAAIERNRTPEAVERRAVLAAVRAAGFRREYTSGASGYYRRRGLVIRVSDHEVPETAEREQSRANGGHTWANSRLSFVIGGGQTIEEFLADVTDFAEAI